MIAVLEKMAAKEQKIRKQYKPKTIFLDKIRRFPRWHLNAKILAFLRLEDISPAEERSCI
jgi:predicted AAA+ superfamily ATPase